MAASVSVETLGKQGTSHKTRWQEPVHKAVLFLFFLACAIAVFVFGSNYYSIFPTNQNIYYEGGIAAIFLVGALILRYLPKHRQYWQIAYAFFVAASVILVTSLTADLRDALFGRVGIAANTDLESAAAKVFEALVTITTILLLSRLAGMRLESLYIRKGNLRLGLLLGFGVMINFATSALMFFSGRFSSPAMMGAVIFWGLVFSFANGFMEELWLRGQFLRKLEPLLGPSVSIVLTSLWWSLFHIGSVYLMPAAIPFYLLNLFTFGLAYGYVMKKTDSWIAPGLMHAAADFFLFVAMLSKV